MGKPHTTNVTRLYYSNGRVTDVQYKWTLKQLQEFVGGYIETVQTTIPHRSLYVNENGLRLELPHNLKATEIVRPGTFMLDGIRGNAVLFKS